MRIISVVLILLAANALQAATFKIFTAVTPPFTEKKGEGLDGLSGVFGDLVVTKIKNAGKASDFEVVWAPWKRALNETLKTKNGLFAPLARTPEREKDFCWLGFLGTAESWFYATNVKVQINSLEDLKKYRIGFLYGSMRETELHKVLGDDAKNLDGLTEDQANYKKLLSGRIDIWVTQTEVFEDAQKNYKSKNKSAHSPTVYPVKKFLDQEIWIVGGAGMEEKYQEQVRAIFATKKKPTSLKRVTPLPLLGKL